MNHKWIKRFESNTDLPDLIDSIEVIDEEVKN